MRFSEESWPLVLLALRIGIAGALYLFLLAAFNTLRRELGARSRPSAIADLAPAPAPPVDVLPEPLPADVEPWEPEPALPSPVRRRRPTRHRERIGARATRWSMLIPIAGGVLAIALAAGGVFATRAPDDREGTAPPSATDPSGPPVEAPDSGEVTVGLAAREDSAVRVTVDGVVQFDGLLRAGERQSWSGSDRIQVWTDKGKTLELAVNGHDLGPYSPAMGHPDWNRIDFGFWPGWPG